MEKLNNTVIKVLNEEHGKKVIEWWKSQGVDTTDFKGAITLDYHGEHCCIYYGVIDNYFNNYPVSAVQSKGAKIIKLPQQKDYSIKGTPLPDIPRGTEYRCSHWEYRMPNDRFNNPKYKMISYGISEHKGVLYVMYEKIDYNGTYHYMTPLSIIEQLDKEQQSKSKPMKTRIIKPEQGQQIIDAACSGWKNTLFDKWGKQIILKHEIAVEEDFYQEMREACTGPQNELFDKIFGKDHTFKVGDYAVPLLESGIKESHCRKVGTAYEIQEVDDYGVRLFTHSGKADGNGFIRFANVRPATQEEIEATKYIPKGTPCLVRDYEDSTWKLVYSNGDGKFTNSGMGRIHTWKYVQVLDINNLPK